MRQRKRERDTERETLRETEKERERHRERDIERDREREREKEREREREREREKIQQRIYMPGKDRRRWFETQPQPHRVYLVKSLAHKVTNAFRERLKTGKVKSHRLRGHVCCFLEQ